MLLATICTVDRVLCLHLYVYVMSDAFGNVRCVQMVVAQMQDSLGIQYTPGVSHLFTWLVCDLCSLKISWWLR